MVQGTMKWTSPTGEFGLLTPDDGSRDIFVRFASAIASTCSPDGRGELAAKEAVVAPTPPRHQVASSVEVRTRYLPGQWAHGYEIAQVVELGYRVRRPGSLDTLPDIFVPADVRRAGD
jgi:cold shock CspA family protein